MNDINYYIYIVANKRNGTLYVGMTNNLVRRINEHKEGKAEGFTKKYNINRLVYYEAWAKPGQAIYREKCLKEWQRAWKIRLIEKDNPNWQDLYSLLL